MESVEGRDLLVHLAGLPEGGGSFGMSGQCIPVFERIEPVAL